MEANFLDFIALAIVSFSLGFSVAILIVILKD